MKLLSRARLLATPCTAAYQAPPSMGFSRQEHWSGLPFCLLLNWHPIGQICWFYFFFSFVLLSANCDWVISIILSSSSLIHSSELICCFKKILFIFLVCLLWLRLPILCWIKVVRLDILVLFLNLVGMLSAFQHWLLCWVLICYKWFLLLLGYVTFIGEGNGTPLQYSCLENPMDGGAW